MKENSTVYYFSNVYQIVYHEAQLSTQVTNHSKSLLTHHTYFPNGRLTALRWKTKPSATTSICGLFFPPTFFYNYQEILNFQNLEITSCYFSIQHLKMRNFNKPHFLPHVSYLESFYFGPTFLDDPSSPSLASGVVLEDDSGTTCMVSSTLLH